MNIQEAVRRELEYFGKHPIYSSLPTELLGTRSLVDRTTSILFEMIKQSLPRIKFEISDRRRRVKEQLEQLGEGFPEKPEQQMELVFRLVRKFKNSYDQELSGLYFHEKKGHRVHRQRAETITFLLNETFQTIYDRYIEPNFKITSSYSDEYIYHAINTYQGESMPGFQSFDSFLFLITPKLELLKGPIYQLLSEAKAILEERGIELIDHVFKKLPKLQNEVKEAFMKSLNNRRQAATKILENIIKCEENYIFTNDSQILTRPI